MTIPYEQLREHQQDNGDNANNETYGKSTKLLVIKPKNHDETSNDSHATTTTTTTTTAPKTVIFETRPKYSCFIRGLVVAVPFLSLVFSVPLLFQQDMDLTKRWAAAANGLIHTLVVLLIYSFILPMKLMVRSDGSIGIATTCWTYSFANIETAYCLTSLCQDVGRARFKFATDWFVRVLVRRSAGFDVVVSPENVLGFIQAIQEVTHGP